MRGSLWGLSIEVKAKWLVNYNTMRWWWSKFHTFCLPKYTHIYTQHTYSSWKAFYDSRRRGLVAKVSGLGLFLFVLTLQSSHFQLVRSRGLARKVVQIKCQYRPHLPQTIYVFSSSLLNPLWNLVLLSILVCELRRWS